jgi:hypothetical protein
MVHVASQTRLVSISMRKVALPVKVSSKVMEQVVPQRILASQVLAMNVHQLQKHLKVLTPLILQ